MVIRQGTDPLWLVRSHFLRVAKPLWDEGGLYHVRILKVGREGARSLSSMPRNISVVLGRTV